MFAFTTQYLVARGRGGLYGGVFRVGSAAVAAVIFASANLTNAAGFHEITAINNASNTAASTSIIFNESRPKNLSVTGATNAAISTKAALVESSDSSICNEKKQPLCRDLAASEFQFASLRFMLPEVRGLSPKSLNVRRNSVSATYPFR